MVLQELLMNFDFDLHSIMLRTLIVNIALFLDQIFMILYRELYFRHVYARVQVCVVFQLTVY